MTNVSSAAANPCRRLKVLLVAELLNDRDVGETKRAFKLVQALCELADVTVLALETRKGPPLAQQLPQVEVVTWKEPPLILRHERVAAMLKLGTLFLNTKASRWISNALAGGRRWDIAHQLTPGAPRYYTVLRRFDIPYVLGPVGGALETPATFRAESASEAWYTKLRNVDQFRFRHDPWLRAGYMRARMVFGVAPYMQEVMQAVPFRKFRPFLGIGIDADALTSKPHPREPGPVRLLHIGRGVRTKGLRDLVRAMALLKDCDITLTSIGRGDEIEVCRKLAIELGVADRVAFLGHLPHARIAEQVAISDIFVFPSFRESMGIVLFEAMSVGLPVITVRAGGPGWIVDDSCGIRIEVTDPQTMPKDLADAIRRLAGDSVLRARMGEAARAKLLSEQIWPAKARQMIGYYEEALAPC